MTRASPRNPFRILIENRNFRLFWFGQTLSLIGTWMQSMSEGWLALELSNSAFVVGLVAAASSLPILLLSLPAGVVVDRTHKLRLVTIAQTLLLSQAAALWYLAWTGRITVGWLLVLATLNGLFGAFEIPARQAMMIELVGREDLRDAIALNSSGFNLARVVGPFIGAAVIASLGIAWCFFFNALSYFTVLIGLLMIRLPPWEKPVILVTPWEGILEGVRYMRTTPSIATLMQLVAVFSILGVPYLTLLPVFARDVLGQGASGYGLLLACVGIGGLIGALFLASVAHAMRRGRLLMRSAYAYAILLMVFALVRSSAFAYPLLLCIGFMMILNNAQANAMLQSIVPDELRGRLMSAYSLVVVGLSQVVGSFLAGTIAHGFGTPWAIGGAATLMLCYCAWVFGKKKALLDL